MDPLRAFLFVCLVIHKVIWEVLRKNGKAGGPGPDVLNSFWRRAIKLVKLSLLSFLLCQTLFLDLFPIFDQPSRIRIIGSLICFLGLGMAILGRTNLGENWVDLEDYRVLPDQTLVTKGIYGYMRHPIYIGDVLLVTGLELALNSWLVLFVPILLFVIIRQALVEESLLLQKFPAYHDYCSQTKRFIPFIV